MSPLLALRRTYHHLSHRSISGKRAVNNLHTRVQKLQAQDELAKQESEAGALCFRAVSGDRTPFGTLRAPSRVEHRLNDP